MQNMMRYIFLLLLFMPQIYSGEMGKWTLATIEGTSEALRKEKAEKVQKDIDKRKNELEEK